MMLAAREPSCGGHGHGLVARESPVAPPRVTGDLHARRNPIALAIRRE